MQTSSIRSLKHKITEDGKPLRPKHVVFEHITYNKHQQAAGKNFPKSRSFPLQAKQTHWGGTGESFTYTRLRPPKRGGGVDAQHHAPAALLSGNVRSSSKF